MRFRYNSVVFPCAFRESTDFDSSNFEDPTGAKIFIDLSKEAIPTL